LDAQVSKLFNSMVKGEINRNNLHNFYAWIDTVLNQVQLLIDENDRDYKFCMNSFIFSRLSFELQTTCGRLQPAKWTTKATDDYINSRS
jgi:hypothetical protein